jgi:uncharacterized protein (TIGR03118 family)
MRISLVAALVSILAAGQAVAATAYEQINLVSDIPGLAAVTDPNLKNPWGMSFTATSPFWVSDERTNVATLYDGAGAPNALVVTVPGGPTGQVANTTSGFPLGAGGRALFIFAALDGSISGWNAAAGMTAVRAVSSFPGTSSYTGLALGGSAAEPLLYAANFRSRSVDTYDSSFASKSASFLDPTLPAGYAPFNIESIGGNLYVAYAKVASTGDEERGPGLGFVDVFDTNGNFVRRLISNGPLNAPWGMTIAPAAFGDFSNDLLVGNFGDGRINAFDPATGSFLGALTDRFGNPIEIDGLWALKVRTGGPAVDPNRVYFTAGINDEVDGLFGAIAVTPEPGTLAMLALGVLAVAVAGRKRAR